MKNGKPWGFPFFYCHETIPIPSKLHTNPIVGVSLLAIAFFQPKHHCLTHRYREQAHSYRVLCLSEYFVRSQMKNDNLRADRDDLDDFIPRASAKREKSLVLQVAAGVFLGGLVLWLVQLAATAAYAKLMMGTITFGS
jgi:hypothetical protein